MLKQSAYLLLRKTLIQPPSGGCVLKHQHRFKRMQRCDQPPSGGCVLKQIMDNQYAGAELSAAFGRLCVETGW